MPETIKATTIQFLKDLAANNNREWFAENKNQYTSANENMKAFFKAIQDEISHHDEIEGYKLFRIYRDVRFSNDKTPYKSNFSGGFTRASKFRRGGYYFAISPQENVVAGGFWNPESKDLTRIRQEISANDSEFRKILNSKSFIRHFGSLQGEQVKSAPKGYKKDHPAIDLLRYKQFLVYKRFTDQEIIAEDFAKVVSETYKAMRPFLDVMTEVLTTDENGVRIE